MNLQVPDLKWLAGSTSRVVKAADYQRLLDASDVLQAARDSAAGLQAQLESARQEAVREGYAAGIEMGKDAWALQLAQRHVAGQAKLWGLQHVLVDVVMNALRHIVASLPGDGRFESLARQMLEAAVRARQMRLIVPAADAAQARAVLERWQLEHPDVLAIDVVVDDALVPGDCILETEDGAVDGSLGKRLALIEATLKRHLSLASRGESGWLTGEGP